MKLGRRFTSVVCSGLMGGLAFGGGRGIPVLAADESAKPPVAAVAPQSPANAGKLEPAAIERPNAPPPRPRSEVQAVLKNAQPVDETKLKPVQIVLVTGPKDHGIGEHDYPLWRERWAQLLSLTPQVNIVTADEWPSDQQWASADCVVAFSSNPGWTAERAKQLDAFFERGGGMVLLHWAVNGHRAPAELAKRIGLAWQMGQSKFRHGELDVKFIGATKHPIIAGFDRAKFFDESYWELTGNPSKITVLAEANEDRTNQPQMWTYEPGHGRVFVSILGHYNWTFDDPLYRVLVLRGMAWSMDQPLDRFNAAIFPGSRTAD